MRLLHILPSLLPLLPFNDSLVLKGRSPSLVQQHAGSCVPHFSALPWGEGLVVVGGASCWWEELPAGLLWMKAVVVQSLSHVQLFATPGNAARQISLCLTNSQSSLWPLHQGGHPTILSSAAPISSSCCESFPASGSFLMSQFFG